jgi:hypothetical protein
MGMEVATSAWDSWDLCREEVMFSFILKMNMCVKWIHRDRR